MHFPMSREKKLKIINGRFTDNIHPTCTTLRHKRHSGAPSDMVNGLFTPSKNVAHVVLNTCALETPVARLIRRTRYVFEKIISFIYPWT